jgi:hypothetical protein
MIRGWEPKAGAVEIVMDAVALLVVSWRLVAVTEKVPVVVPAVKRPVEETVPPVAVQVTAVLAAFVTVAANCCVPFVKTVAADGVTLTPTDAGPVIVMFAEALLAGSCTLVAVTVKEPVVEPAE